MSLRRRKSPDPVQRIVIDPVKAVLFELEEMVINDIDEAVNKVKDTDRRDPNVLREVIRLAIRRRIKQELGKRPLLDVHLVQMS